MPTVSGRKPIQGNQLALATAATQGAMPANNLTAGQMNLLSADMAAGARGMVLIEAHTSPVGGEAYHDFTFASASYRRLVIVAEAVYVAAVQGYKLQPDAADTGCACNVQFNAGSDTGTNVAVQDPIGDMAIASFMATRANAKGAIADIWRMPSGYWMFSSISLGTGSSSGHARYMGRMPAWTTKLRLAIDGNGVLNAGSKFTLMGEPDATFTPSAITGCVDVNGATYSATLADSVLQVRRTLAGACAITIPAGVAGKRIWVKDSGYWSGTNAISITPTGDDAIEGGASYVINIDGDSVCLVYNAVTENWEAL
jgi:hypothetical protein